MRGRSTRVYLMTRVLPWLAVHDTYSAADEILIVASELYGGREVAVCLLGRKS